MEFQSLSEHDLRLDLARSDADTGGFGAGLPELFYPWGRRKLKGGAAGRALPGVQGSEFPAGGDGRLAIGQGTNGQDVSGRFVPGKNSGCRLWWRPVSAKDAAGGVGSGGSR